MTSRRSARSGVREIKWDGYRVSVYVADGKATFRTRNGHDWTAHFPALKFAGVLTFVLYLLLGFEGRDCRIIKLFFANRENRWPTMKLRLKRP